MYVLEGKTGKEDGERQGSMAKKRTREMEADGWKHGKVGCLFFMYFSYTRTGGLMHCKILSSISFPVSFRSLLAPPHPHSPDVSL